MELARQLQRLFPGGVEVEVAVDADAEAPLLEGEAPAVARAVPARVREFTQGRTAARRAIARLGMTPAAIPARADRSPHWPAAVVGSIAHSHGHCAAAVASSHAFASLGLDIERARPLPDGVLRHVCTEPEREWIARQDDGALWDTLTFAAKEAFYKAWYPVTGRFLGFDAVAIRFDPHAREFAPAPAGEACAAPDLAPFRGRWFADQDWVYASAWALTPPPGASAPRSG